MSRFEGGHLSPWPVLFMTDEAASVAEDCERDGFLGSSRGLGQRGRPRLPLAPVSSVCCCVLSQKTITRYPELLDTFVVTLSYTTASTFFCFAALQ